MKALLAFYLGQTPKEWKELGEERFNIAKKMSDFIGMAFRLSLLLTAFQGFIKFYKEYTGLAKYVMGVSAIISFGFLVHFSSAILYVILIFWVKDTAHGKSQWGKWVAACMGIFTSVTI